MSTADAPGFCAQSDASCQMVCSSSGSCTSHVPYKQFASWWFCACSVLSSLLCLTEWLAIVFARITNRKSVPVGFRSWDWITWEANRVFWVKLSPDDWQKVSNMGRGTHGETVAEKTASRGQSEGKCVRKAEPRTSRWVTSGCTTPNPVQALGYTISAVLKYIYNLHVYI